MAPGESLRICHDLRGLLALGKGDRWSWLSPWVLQNQMIGLPWQLKPPVEASKKVDVGGGIELAVEYVEPPKPEEVVVKEKRRRRYGPRGHIHQKGWMLSCNSSAIHQNVTAQLGPLGRLPGRT